MRNRLGQILAAALLLASGVLSNKEIINSADSIKCSGAWNAKDIPTQSSNSTISVIFNSISVPSSNYSLLIFNFLDQPALAGEEESGTLNVNLFRICGTEGTIENGACTANEAGLFVVNKTHKLVAPIHNEVVTVRQDASRSVSNGGGLAMSSYIVQETGYYCIVVLPVVFDNEFDATLEFKNPYGLLPATDYPKLPLYGFLSIIYLLIALGWSIKAWRYYKDLLPIQNYLTGVIVFVMIEQAFNYGYYEDYNNTGVSSKALMGVVSILTAGRNSVSFFILLIVSLGYGVVRPSLGSTMTHCQILAIAHFVFGVSYSIGAMMVVDSDPSDTSVGIVFLFVLPLSVTMTCFYYWTLHGLDDTITKLRERKQFVKLKMYTSLRRILLFSLTVLLIAFVVNGVFFHSRADSKSVNTYWRNRWILLDGWLNLLFLTIFLGIIYLWRPTEDNQRFSMAELAQDDFDEEFESELDNLPAPVGFVEVMFKEEEGVVQGAEVNENDHEELLNWASENIPSAKDEEKGGKGFL